MSDTAFAGITPNQHSGTPNPDPDSEPDSKKPDEEPDLKPDPKPETTDENQDNTSAQEKTETQEQSRPRRRHRRNTHRRTTPSIPAQDGVSWSDLEHLLDWADAYQKLSEYERELYRRAFGWESPEDDTRSLPTVMRGFFGDRVNDSAKFDFANHLMRITWSRDSDIVKLMELTKTFSELDAEIQSGSIGVINGFLFDHLPELILTEGESVAMFGDAVAKLAELWKNDQSHADYIKGVLDKIESLTEQLNADKD